VDELDFTKYQYKEFEVKEKTWLNLALTHTTDKEASEQRVYAAIFTGNETTTKNIYRQK